VKAGHLYGINENKPWTGPEYFMAPTDGMVIPGRSMNQSGIGQSNQPIILEYKPLISLATQREAQEVLIPFIKEALRQA